MLQRIQESGLVPSTKKCAFGVKDVTYLGTVIKEGMLCIREQKTAQLRDIPAPNSVEEVRRALGPFAFVQRWLPGLADVARPLYDLIGCKGRQKFVWNSACNGAFENLKDMVAKAMALRISREDLEFTVVTDASDIGTGAMLAQKEGQLLVPVAFCHHALTAAERKYNTAEK